MSNKTLDNIKNILLDLDAKISHIEDMEADNRTVIIKLVKQNNQIVDFLKQLELHEVYDEEVISSSDLLNKDMDNSKNLKSLKELINEYMDTHKDLKEFEEELKELKNQITPGQVGES